MSGAEWGSGRAAVWANSWAREFESFGISGELGH